MVKVLILLLLPMICLPAVTEAQGRWRAALFETGFGTGPQGFSKASGFSAEVGISGNLRAVVRWSQRSRALCATDGTCPRDSDVVEMGPSIRLGAGSRAVSFANVLFGVHWEEDAYSAEKTPYSSASVSIGVDLRLFPPLTLRIALRHQEVPGSETRRWGKPNARNTGIVVGFGATAFGFASRAVGLPLGLGGSQEGCGTILIWTKPGGGGAPEL